MAGFYGELSLRKDDGDFGLFLFEDQRRVFDGVDLASELEVEFGEGLLGVFWVFGDDGEDFVGDAETDGDAGGAVEFRLLLEGVLRNRGIEHRLDEQGSAEAAAEGDRKENQDHFVLGRHLRLDAERGDLEPGSFTTGFWR